MFGFRFTLGRFIRTIAMQRQKEQAQQGDRAARAQIPNGGAEEGLSSIDHARSEHR